MYIEGCYQARFMSIDTPMVLLRLHVMQIFEHSTSYICITYLCPVLICSVIHARQACGFQVIVNISINCLQGVSYGKVNSYEQGERNEFDQGYERYVSMGQEQGLQGQ